MSQEPRRKGVGTEEKRDGNPGDKGGRKQIKRSINRIAVGIHLLRVGTKCEGEKSGKKKERRCQQQFCLGEETIINCDIYL